MNVLGYPRLTELYHYKYNRWTSADSLQIGRSGHQAVLMPDGSVLVIGGATTERILAGSERYVPASQ